MVLGFEYCVQMGASGTVDQAIVIQDGIIRLRYWSSRFRRHADDTSTERMVVQLSGFAFHIYNNSAKYAQMQKMAAKYSTPAAGAAPAGSDRRDGKGDGKGDAGLSRSASDDGADLAPTTIEVPPAGVPFFFKMFPVIRIRIVAGRVVAGNRKLPAALVVVFRSANIMVTTDKDNTKTKNTDLVDPYVCGLPRNLPDPPPSPPRAAPLAR